MVSTLRPTCRKSRWGETNKPPVFVLFLWLFYFLLLTAFGAFVASHYYHPTLREQAARWGTGYLLICSVLLWPNGTIRSHLPGPIAWLLVSRLTLHEAYLPLLFAYGLFGLFLVYFVPKYYELNLGDQRGTIREVMFPFRCAALTFDDGPSPLWTPQILDVLDRHQVKATFFMVGKAVEKYPDLVREVARRGHSVGSHSWSHPYMPLLDPEALTTEIDRTSDALEAVLGTRPRLFRPPWGFYNRRVLDELRARNYLTVLWTRSSQDWSNPGVEKIVANATTEIRSGEIFLFHDGGNHPSKELPTDSRRQTVEALDAVIRNLEAQGFELRSLDEMIAAWVS